MAFNIYTFTFNKEINNTQLISEINAAVAKTMLFGMRYIPTDLPADFPRILTIKTEDPVVLTAGEQTTVDTTITNHVPTQSNQQDKQDAIDNWDTKVAAFQQLVTDFQADFNNTPTTTQDLIDNQLLIKDFVLEMADITTSIT